MAAIIGRKKVMDLATKTFISSAFWTERLGPACALTFIKKHKKINLGEKLTNTGKKISSRITNGSILIPHEWLCRSTEIKIPHARRSLKWGIFISARLLSHEWGINIDP